MDKYGHIRDSDPILASMHLPHNLSHVTSNPSHVTINLSRVTTTTNYNNNSSLVSPSYRPTVTEHIISKVTSVQKGE